MNILSVRNLKKYYNTGENTVKALDGIDLDICKGEFLAVVGTSGSGKSTLLHMLGGLDNPTSGEVIIDGRNISGLSRDELTVYRRRKIGFVFQNYNLLPLMNVYENIVLPIKLDGIKPDDDYIEEILKLLKLEDKKYFMPNQLSGGQQQRVALARALAIKPAIILADEPTGNLDSRTSQDVLGLIKISSQNLAQTIVMITHNEEIAKTTYKANKKRNLLTIVAIFLTTFLLCTVISVGLSYWDTVSLRQQRMQGIDYDIELTEPRDDQVSTIRKMDNVRYAGLSVKCGIASKYQDKELDKLKFYWLDDTCWKQQTIPALDYYKGNYPAKENEIMLSQSALRSMGIENPKVGMELPFIYQTLAENSENNDTAKTFILSGWFLDYTGVDKGYVSDEFYQSTGVLQTDLTQGTLKISLKNPLYSEKDVIEMQNQINLSGNQIIEADYDTISNNRDNICSD